MDNLLDFLVLLPILIPVVGGKCLSSHFELNSKGSTLLFQTASIFSAYSDCG